MMVEAIVDIVRSLMNFNPAINFTMGLVAFFIGGFVLWVVTLVKNAAIGFPSFLDIFIMLVYSYVGIMFFVGGTLLWIAAVATLQYGML